MSSFDPTHKVSSAGNNQSNHKISRIPVGVKNSSDGATPDANLPLLDRISKDLFASRLQNLSKKGSLAFFVDMSIAASTDSGQKVVRYSVAPSYSRPQEIETYKGITQHRSIELTPQNKSLPSYTIETINGQLRVSRYNKDHSFTEWRLHSNDELAVLKKADGSVEINVKGQGNLFNYLSTLPDNSSLNLKD
ncbi:hypothetical protein SAMN06265795_103296 [Noviherbaspirillum humi]|uniref:Uncharacterized protein n=1 Tax=Noviherbaspirillum humi TaxID=1688639 RepID=A0A239FEJ6_9BURK|nr:hypothetical protein [Noviherbaspirillum humi]SNS54602.1 hypothetical protein SAMN06265795_103296 [Noviherbaspirillum humi]